MPAKDSGLDTRDWPSKYAILSVDSFFVDPDYQRPVTSLADEIGANFRRELVGTLTVNDRGGRRKARHALIDGQTRWVGAQIAVEDVLPAVVFEGLTPQQEAELFADIQINRRNLASFERFRAQVMAGRPIQVAISDAAEAEGFRLGYSTEQKTDNTVISAVAALERIYANGSKGNIKKAIPGDVEAGQALIRQVLRVLKASFPDREMGYVSGEMLRGMGAFLTSKNYAGQNGPGEDRLIQRLQGADVREIFRRANAFRDTGASGSTAKYYADAINAVAFGRR